MLLVLSLLLACEPALHPQDQPVALADLADLTARTWHDTTNESALVVSLDHTQVLGGDAAVDALRDGEACPVVLDLEGELDGVPFDDISPGGWWDMGSGEHEPEAGCDAPSFFVACDADATGEVRLRDPAGTEIAVDITAPCQERAPFLAEPVDGVLVPGQPAAIQSDVAGDTWDYIPDDFDVVYLRWAEGSDGWASADAQVGAAVSFTTPDEVPAGAQVELWPNMLLQPEITRCEGVTACTSQSGDYGAYGYGVLLVDAAR